MVARVVEKKVLSARGLLKIVREGFEKIKVPLEKSKPHISIAEGAVMGLSDFNLRR